MPQLNPHPWFSIMLISWLTFLFILQPKLLSFIPINSPSNKTIHTTKTTPWDWPWT